MPVQLVQRLFFVFVLLFGLSQQLLAREPDLENGEEINEVCAGCHGVYGEGGKQGEYPRIAGQPYQFLVNQLSEAEYELTRARM